jgi:hypothetical protein
VRPILWVLAALAVLAVIVVLSAGRGGFGAHEAPGVVRGAAVPADEVAAREASRAEAAREVGARGGKRILFGDFHVHTTFSMDAFLLSLPLLAGEGAHPPADACDFARYCSALDFWSINDHAEGITPRHWRETVESIRQCNDVAGEAEDPDLVAFLGWEWTQVGLTPEDHYGHKNVVLAHTDDGRIPTRPIAARPVGRNLFAGPGLLVRAFISLFGGDDRYDDLARYLDERARMRPCPDGVPERELPDDCHETAAEPADLFAKLDEWDVESVVIPHGTTWGLYTPAGSTWDKQLSAAQYDPDRQTLVEVFSGHGNSEVYRPWRAARFDSRGDPVCPEPSPDYLPSCWRAGEIIRGRCLAAGEDQAECERRAVEARRNYLAAGVAGHLTVPGATIQDWLDAGQCRDCVLPAFNYRPGGSVQYMMALSNFDDPAAPRRFRFGFMASSDNHTARPGTGYKEIDRREFTEATGARDEAANEFLRPDPVPPAPRSEPFDPTRSDLLAFQLAEFERQASFFTTGGLVAVHAAGRDRDAIWQALARREVYGTSGDRILLWFDLLNAPGPAGRLESAPMGTELSLAANPVFQVRAVGAFQQKPGCPDVAVSALDAERLHHLCRGECYNPSDERKRITRIEVVRIRPQVRPGEPVETLIEDPWRVFECDGDPAGCAVRFEDREFAAANRDTVYYVRAIQEPTLVVNAGNLRCTRDANGNCTEVRPCFGDYRTDYEDDCTAPEEERAWSSPIFVNRSG